MSDHPTLAERLTYRWTHPAHLTKVIDGHYVRDDLKDATALLAEAREALATLVGHFNAFTNKQRGGWGNQEDAYYCLAKGAQDSWAKAKAVHAKLEKAGG